MLSISFLRQEDHDSPRRLRLLAGTTQFAESQNEGIDLTPRDFRLEQNYPNPFNPQTQIRFTIPVQEHVTLEVLDLLGRRIKVLVDRELPAGAHDVVWNGLRADGAPAATGMYLYRIRSGDHSVTKKMLLIR